MAMPQAPLFNLRLDHQTKSLWKAAADEEDMSVSAYVKSVVTTMAKARLGPEKTGAVLAASVSSSPLEPSGASSFHPDPRPVKGKKK